MVSASLSLPEDTRRLMMPKRGRNSNGMSPMDAVRAGIPDLRNAPARNIIAYHDSLLSVIAFPENRITLKFAKKSMVAFLAKLKKAFATGSSLYSELEGTGIAGTELTGRFSYTITKWLIRKFPSSVFIDSSTAKPETVRLLFRQLLPEMEYEGISAKECTLSKRIGLLKGNSSLSDLEWLIRLMERSSLPDMSKEFLFHELGIFITWKLNDHLYSRSNLRIPVKKIYYRTSPGRELVQKKIIQLKLPAPEKLSWTRKQNLVNLAKASLAILYSETETFSFADPKQVKLFYLERGYSIALYSMEQEHRYSIESYIGFFVFSNGLPVAYGGGWLFGRRCQFGINILEPFRGNESSLIFSALIRVYHQYYGAVRFFIKPYQFGNQNEEGIRSGAFWFYYKFGFCPENERLKVLALHEWENIKRDKKYRSSRETLKKLAGSGLVLDLSSVSQPLFDAARVSETITEFINREFNGDRTLAQKVCWKKTLNELNIKDLQSKIRIEKKIWAQWSLLAQAVLKIPQWQKIQRRAFLRLVNAKGHPDERKFIMQLQQHKKFWEDLSKTIHGGNTE